MSSLLIRSVEILRDRLARLMLAADRAEALGRAQTAVILRTQADRLVNGINRIRSAGLRAQTGTA